MLDWSGVDEWAKQQRDAYWNSAAGARVAADFEARRAIQREFPGEGPREIPSGAARTIRNRARIERGIHPLGVKLLEPRGQACGRCAHLVEKQSGSRRRYFKCALGPDTRGAASDIRKSWPACQSFEPKKSLRVEPDANARALIASTDPLSRLVLNDWCTEHGMSRRFWLDIERKVALALSPAHTRYLPATFEKRFGDDIAELAAKPEALITFKQGEQLWRSAFRYRKQLAKSPLGAIPIEWSEAAHKEQAEREAVTP